MSLRINITSALRSLATRPKPSAWLPPACLPARRGFADDAALTTTSTSSQASTDHIQSLSGSPRASDQISGTASEAVSEIQQTRADANGHALSQLELVAYGLNPFDPALAGHKFGLPQLPLAPHLRLKKRYSPLIEQMTRLLMRDGKLSKAQRDMAMVLNYLRTSSAPRYDTKRPLLPETPPPHHLPLDPLRYFALALDAVAPLVKIRRFPGLAGGGRPLEVPVPLAERPRRRQAFLWIMDAVEKKPNMGSGRTMFAHRIGEEIVAVVEGRSSVWQRRDILHNLAKAVRANVNSSKLNASKKRR